MANEFNCSGRTKEGYPCARKVSEEGAFCYQHGPKYKKILKRIKITGVLGLVITFIGLTADLTAAVTTAAAPNDLAAGVTAVQPADPAAAA